MIFGIKEKFDPCNVVLAIAKYTSATYDWFCGPGSQLWNNQMKNVSF